MLDKVPSDARIPSLSPVATPTVLDPDKDLPAYPCPRARTNRSGVFIKITPGAEVVSKSQPSEPGGDFDKQAHGFAR